MQAQAQFLSDSIVKRRTLLWHMGERFAANFLTAQGWTIVDKNWRAGRYEIDIITMTPDQLLVFVEVKTRITSIHPGLSMYGVESLTHEKKQKLVAAANIYLHHNELVDRGARLDVIIVSYPRKNSDFKQSIKADDSLNADNPQSAANPQPPDRLLSAHFENPDELIGLDESELKSRLEDPVATHIVQAFY